jgi:hypothetical protein
MTLKQKIHSHCAQLLNNKIGELELIFDELSESAANNTKSSAGDKHETARAMIQIEQETISKQLNKALEQRLLLEKIDSSFNSLQIINGSLVKTRQGYLFLSIAFGKITVDGKAIIAISPQSPLGIKLMGLRINDKTEINGMSYFIEGIY